MEQWELLFPYAAIWIVFGISYMYLFDTNLGMVALLIATLTHVFMGILVWFGDLANPTIQMLPSLMTNFKLDMKTLFMGIWGLALLAMLFVLDKFRRLHSKFNNDGLPIDLGKLRKPIGALYGYLSATECLLLLQLWFVLWYQKDTIQGMIHKYGFTNMLILYFAAMTILGVIECDLAYRIYKVA